MSVHLSIRFLAGRYHATPWDHQVNEGVVEWPPSPWRILRTLVAQAYRSAAPPDRQDLRELVSALAESLPQYSLPPAEAAHTRHYMPVWKEGKATTSLVFDTFLALGQGASSKQPPEVIVSWLNTELSDKSLALLKQLCKEVNYLGRAESWAEMKVVESPAREYDAAPSEQAVINGGKRVKVLAPLSEEGLKGFQAALEALPKPKGKKQKPLFSPSNVLEALELDVTDLFNQGWNGIPGTQWVAYDVKESNGYQRQSQPLFISGPDAPNFARYTLNSNVLPSLTEAISVGDRFRASLMSLSDGALVFSGRDEQGNPAEGHQHAWYLPEVNQNGRIDHIVVYAAGGFSTREAIAALQKLNKVWGKEGFDIQTVLVSLGRVEHYRAEVPGETKGRSLVTGKGKVWQSLTPVVFPRFPKKGKFDPDTGLQIDGPEHQLRRLLKQIGKDDPIEVEEIEDGKSVGIHPWHTFQRERFHGNGQKGLKRGYGFKLVFEQPQEGPIALGYAAHFGLGVFVAVE